MFKIWFTNFGYIYPDGFKTLDEAKAKILTLCFEAVIYSPQNELVLSYSPLNGFSPISW